jgi:hypothetical protein
MRVRAAARLARARPRRETGLFEMAVGLVEAHRAAVGDAEGFVEVALGAGKVVAQAVELGAGEEAAWEVVLLAGLAEAADGLVEVGLGFGEVATRLVLGLQDAGATKGEMIEGDVEERSLALCPCQCRLGVV